MQVRQVIEDVDVEDITELSHLLLAVLVIFPQAHLFEEVASQKASLLLCESGFIHGLDDAVKTLNITVTAFLTAQFNQHMGHVPPHGLNLILGSAKPNIGPFHIPAYPFQIVSGGAAVVTPPFR